MTQRIKRTRRDYTLTFKQSVVDQVERGELSYQETQACYGIQGNSTLLVWLHRYGRQDWSRGAASERHRSTPMSNRPPTPEQRIQQLEEQL